MVQVHAGLVSHIMQQLSTHNMILFWGCTELAWPARPPYIIPEVSGISNRLDKEQDPSLSYFLCKSQPPPNPPLPRERIQRRQTCTCTRASRKPGRQKLPQLHKIPLSYSHFKSAPVVRPFIEMYPFSCPDPPYPPPGWQRGGREGRAGRREAEPASANQTLAREVPGSLWTVAYLFSVCVLTTSAVSGTFTG